MACSEPYSIHPGAFNLIGSPYKDMHCLERAGGDHVVSGHAFGIGSGDCSLSPLVRGPRHALTECRADHTVYAQVCVCVCVFSSRKVHLGLVEGM